MWQMQALELCSAGGCWKPSSAAPGLLPSLVSHILLSFFPSCFLAGSSSLPTGWAVGAPPWLDCSHRGWGGSDRQFCCVSANSPGLISSNSSGAWPLPEVTGWIISDVPKSCSVLNQEVMHTNEAVCCLQGPWVKHLVKSRMLFQSRNPWERLLLLMRRKTLKQCSRD